MKFKNKSKTKMLISALSVLVAASVVAPICGMEACAKARITTPVARIRPRADLSPSLFRAVELGDIPAIGFYMAAHADINAQDDDGDTPLHLAAQGGILRVIRVLLAYHPNINAQNDDGKTPLYCAVEAGNTDVVNELIRNHADVNISDALGYTPLHIASSRGYHVMVQSLLNNGAASDVRAGEGDTPLTMAIRDADETTVNCFLGRQGIDLDLGGACGNTPLHEAVLQGDVRLAQALIDSGAYVDAQNDKGNTPLMFTTFDRGNPEMARILLDAGACCEIRGERGATPLHKAVELGQEDMVRVLLQSNPSLDIRDDAWRAPRDLPTTPNIRCLLNEYAATQSK
ncbi:MAG: ankyrin repeat domain-containing protein [Clostridia bacterium]|nr:ankyrin repeat domain-containing protein [Clostridia bacterium]MBR2735535.1 ankyrin repeat domain-containing protein [Clostridia bacterium]